ncbi:unnamed protein product [Polarella glacialis]|uniref:Uncharacterized protein n=1 Tax=Polarella glacialis TaxID=89957 RepID=A0A813DL50_POLGL|nr:unnamed protein product [Polarella glacialis]
MVATLNSIVCSFRGNLSGCQSWLLWEGFVGNEAQSRMLINVVLLEVCREAGLTLHPEQSLPTSAPVAGVADYVLRHGSATSAVVEAKLCCPSQWASLFTSALAQTLTLLAALSEAESQTGLLHIGPLGIVTDARRWLLVRLPQQCPPVLQCWPNGAVVLELSGPSALGLLICSLQDMLGPKQIDCPSPETREN